MSEIVRFRSAQHLAAERHQEELRADARRMIAELGHQAGYQVGVAARLPRLAPQAREHLLAIAAEIKNEQGFGWYFADEESA
jgi:hypothetical protein